MQGAPLDIELQDNSIAVGKQFRISFQRTLRIPDDGRTYPLPPGLGRFPVVSCETFTERLPPDWRGAHCFLIPMYQREALWLGFTVDWPPVALKIAVGRVNAISGRVNEEGLHSHPQDYVVCPEQLWLDGFNSGTASVRQFVAMPLGQGYTVEEAVTGKAETGGIQVDVFEPRANATLTRAAAAAVSPARSLGPGARMGLGAGGQMTQKIYPDPHGVGAWNKSPAARLFIHIVNSSVFRELTGVEAPPTPVDAGSYTARGYPWFELYEERMGDVAAPDPLANARTIAQRDRELGVSPMEDSVDLGSARIVPAKGGER